MLPAALDFIERVQRAAFSGDDVLCRLGPSEGLRFCIVLEQVVVDGGLQIVDGPTPRASCA